MGINEIIKPQVMYIEFRHDIRVIELSKVASLFFVGSLVITFHVLNQSLVSSTMVRETIIIDFYFFLSKI